MKINAKVLKPMLLSAAAIMLVVATVFATMAYMTSSSAVSNVFTVGNVDITLFETKVNSDGKPVDSSGNVINPVDTSKFVKTDTNSYHLMPGVSYMKDPTVYVNENSDECYLFVRVRNDLKTIEKQGDPAHPTINKQLQANGWVEIERAETNVDAVYVYVGKENGATIQTAIAEIPEVGEEYDVETGKAPTDATTVKEILTIAKRTKLILDALKQFDAQKVGGATGINKVDVFKEFTLSTDCSDVLNKFGGARVAIVAYAIQTKGLTEAEQTGHQDAYLKAWKYIKEELPFVV